MTNKEIYDLNNMNVAAQNIELGTNLDKLIKLEQPTLQIDDKKCYDLNNMNVIFQNYEIGNLLQAIYSGNTEGIEDLTEQEIEDINSINVAAQTSQLVDLIQTALRASRTDDKYLLTVVSNNETYGTVSGGGEYKPGQTVVLTAAHSLGYKFVNWTINGTEVSTLNPYNYTTTQGNVTITGNFAVLTEAYLNSSGAAYLLSEAGENPSNFTSLRFTNNNQYIVGATEICSMSDIGDDSIVAYKNGTDLIIYSPAQIKVKDTGFSMTQLNGLTNIYFDNFDTSAMQIGTGMFEGCTSLESLDFNGLATSNLTNTRSMFYNCTSLARIYVSQNNSDWTSYNITNSQDMFYGCTQLPNYDVSEVDINKAKVDTDGGYFTLTV